MRETRDQALSHGIVDCHEDDRDRAGRPLECGGGLRTVRDDHIGRRSDEFGDLIANPSGIAAGEPVIDPDVTPFDLSDRLQPMAKRRDTAVCFGIVLGQAQEEADPLETLCGLRDGPEGPTRRRCTCKADKLASSHGTRRESIAQSTNHSSLVVAALGERVSAKCCK
jgi:hypothetical protein